VLEDQCAWYGLSYIIDTTLGLVLAVIFLRMLDRVANDRDWVHLKHSGVYTGPGGWKSYVLQLLAWMVIQTLVKIVIYFFMWGFSDALAEFGGFLFKPLQSNIRFELVFVMILFPGVLNCVYFWIADSYLKAKKDAPGGAHEPGLDESGKTQSLLDDIAEAELVKPGLVPDWSSLSKIKQEANDQPL
jgi:STIMATE family